MASIFLNGERVGEVSAPAEVLADVAAGGPALELRDGEGNRVGAIVPPVAAPWAPGLTRERIDRKVAAGGGIPLAGFWARMGAE